MPVVRKNQVHTLLLNRVASNPVENPPLTQTIKTQVKIPVSEVKTLMDRQV